MYRLRAGKTKSLGADRTNVGSGANEWVRARARALKPPHAATDGLISEGFFVYFHPIGSSPPLFLLREASLCGASP